MLFRVRKDYWRSIYVFLNRHELLLTGKLPSWSPAGHLLCTQVSVQFMTPQGTEQDSEAMRAVQVFTLHTR